MIPMHDQDGQRTVWVNAHQVTSVTRAKTGPDPADENDPPAIIDLGAIVITAADERFIVTEHAADIVAAIDAEIVP